MLLQVYLLYSVLVGIKIDTCSYKLVALLLLCTHYASCISPCLHALRNMPVSVLLQLQLCALAIAASLPSYTGNFGVGFSQHVVPHSTPQDPTPGPGNALLVHLYYPTRDTKTPANVPYFDDKSAVIWNELLNLPTGSLLKLTTGLRGNASFLDAPTGLPTILFSPGGGVNAWMYYGLLADLASHGYTVAAIDHPGEPPALRWPNGTETIGWDIKLAYTPTLIDEMHAYRVSDLDAVMAWLTTFVHKTKAPVSTASFYSMGHSIGGSAAVHIVPRHAELRAAVNVDGAFPETETQVTNVGRPVFMLSNINHTTQFDPTWATFQNHQTGWWQSVSVYGAGHLDYSDIATWNTVLGFPPLIQDQLGPTGGERTTQIARKYLGDFFRWMQVPGRGKGVLAAPSLRWREAVYVNGSDY